MKKSFANLVALNNGVKMPNLGLGVALIDSQEKTAEVVSSAIELGYRLIDTAARYENEQGVGEGVRRSGIPREEIFITTKVRNRDLGYHSTRRAFEKSLSDLGLEYIDLYMLHWPIPGYFEDGWQAMVELYREGRIKALGVCNCTPDTLDELIRQSGIVPAVNQVECHPLLTRNEIRQHCEKRGVQMEAWSPLMQGHLDVPVLQEIARAHGKSEAQVVLRWHMQRGTIIIPKTTSAKRLQENADVFDFSLTREEMEQISGLNQNKHFGPDMYDIEGNPFKYSYFETPENYLPNRRTS